MAHKKAGSTKASQKGNVIGKRLGVKIFGGSSVRTGQIILRQRGRTHIAGDNVRMARDYTLYATNDGTVQFEIVKRLGNKKKVSVVTQ